MIDPSGFLRFAWEAGTVFHCRSVNLACNPVEAGYRLSDMAMEKLTAFTEGSFAAWGAALVGTRPDLIAAAAMAPAQRLVEANHRSLNRAD